MNKKIFIGDREISETSPTFIIAELSCNHRGDIDIAIRTIDEMHKAGADCVKLQTIKPESLTLDSNKSDFVIKGGTLWDDKTLFNLYKEVYTPWEWHKEIKEYVESKGMVFFSSPFDFEAVDFLEELGVPAYKIASFEITDIPLIRYTASKGKPIIISTGIAEPEDIELAIKTCQEVGNENLIFLKCTSAYPTPLEEVNVKVIPDMKDKYNCLIGLSDHTLGSIVPSAAVALGARIVEKHFILDKSLGGPDAAFSMEPNEFKEMVNIIRNIEKSLGNVTYELSERVKKNRQFSRSLYIVKDIKEGEVFTEDNIRSIRPGFGLHPKYYDQILGKKSQVTAEKGTRLEMNMIKQD
jgi:pseudaminic acid synthase